MVSCILLAAGFSVRFGSPKALAIVQGQPIIANLQNMLLKTQVLEIIIVLGAHADQLTPHLMADPRIRSVYNNDYRMGQTSSFQAGLKKVSPTAEAVLLLPLDYPFVHENTINSLCRHFQENGKLLGVVPSYAARKGHPPLLGIPLRDEILALDSSQGLNTILHTHSLDMKILPVPDPGVIQTFNTPQEFDALLKLRNT